MMPRLLNTAQRPDAVFVIGSLDLGGAERHLLQVLPELKRRGWQVELYCVTRRGVMADALEEKGVPVYTPTLVGQCKPGILSRVVGVVAALIELTVHLWTRRPALAHFFLPEAYIIGGICALIAQTPVRIMSRRSLNDYQQGRPISRWVERRLHHTMHHVLGNSRAVVEQLNKEGFTVERVSLIYNGIELTQLRSRRGRAEVRLELGIAPMALVYVLVANLIPYKGHRDALQAFAFAQSDLPEGWTVLMVGRDNGIGELLRTEAAALGIGDHVKWLGMRRDVPDLLAASDVGLLCSHQEGFSNAILEAMGAGLPVIATDVGGNAEAVLNGQTGRIVPARSPSHLAEAIVSLADKERREKMGSAARARVESLFSLSSCVDRYESCYRKLGLAPRANPGCEKGDTIS